MKMTMKIVFCAMLLLSACAPAEADVEMREQETPPVLLSTSTPLPAATPSPDMIMHTAIAWSGTATENASLRNLEIARHNGTLAAQYMTRTAFEKTQLAATATAWPAAATLTVVVATHESARFTAVAFAPTATVYAIMAQSRERTEAWLFPVRVILAGVLAALAIILFFAVFGILVAPREVVINRPPPVSINVHLDKSRTQRMSMPPISNVDNFLRWSDDALGGGGVSIDRWESAGMYQSAYRPLHAWLMSKDFVTVDAETKVSKLNEKGRAVIAAIVEYLNNPPPGVVKLPENIEIPSVCTESVHTDTEGEGQ